MDNEELIKRNRRAEIAFQALSDLAEIVDTHDRSTLDSERAVARFETILKRAAAELDATFK